mgnify:FL=1
MPHILNMLEAQSSQTFDFFIWNNSPETDLLKGNLRDTSFDLTVRNSKTNVGGIGRFHFSRELWRSYPKIIFLDDDQDIAPNFVSQMQGHYQDNSIVSNWGWLLHGSYLKRTRVVDMTTADYCGTGGMILDASVFANDCIFDIPEGFQFIEDLWLSYVAKYELGFSLYGCAVSLTPVHDGHNQYPRLMAKKEALYSFLIQKYGLVKG